MGQSLQRAPANLTPGNGRRVDEIRIFEYDFPSDRQRNISFAANNCRGTCPRSTFLGTFDRCEITEMCEACETFRGPFPSTKFPALGHGQGPRSRERRFPLRFPARAEFPRLPAPATRPAANCRRASTTSGTLADALPLSTPQKS